LFQNKNLKIMAGDAAHWWIQKAPPYTRPWVQSPVLKKKKSILRWLLTDQFNMK
jgi:hypothetical protein